MTNRSPKILGITVAMALAAGGLAGASPAGAVAVTEYEGTVVSVDRDSRSFRLRDSERGTIRIKVKPSTRFERIDGFRALTAGMNRVEALVRRSGGAWVAVEVERSGGGGRHGGDDGRRGDN